MPYKSNLRKEGFSFESEFQGILPIAVERHQEQEAATYIVSLDTMKQSKKETEKDKRWCSAYFLLFIQFKTPSQVRVLPTLETGLPPLTNLI